MYNLTTSKSELRASRQSHQEDLSVVSVEFLLEDDEYA
jgi:hypothetical protein